jgi:hypothetical protein
MSFTWDPNKCSSRIALSNGNRTATAINVSYTLHSVISNWSKSSGKWYWEIEKANPSSNYNSTGVCDQSPTTDFDEGTRSGWNESWSAYDYSGTLRMYHDGSYAQYSGNDPRNCSRLMFAIDIDTGRLWVGADGSWFNSGSPESDSNPIVTDASMETIISACFSPRYVGDSVTCCFEASQQTYTPPSGFSALESDPDTFDPNATSTNITLSDGNRAALSSWTNWKTAFAYNPKSSGKWYFELEITSTAGSEFNRVGVVDANTNITNYVGATSRGYSYGGYNGKKYNNNAGVAYGNTFTADDVVGVALDLDNGEIYFSKNGVWQNSGDPANRTNPAFTGLEEDEYFAGFSPYSNGNAGKIRLEYSQLSYDPPSGFLSWDELGGPVAYYVIDSSKIDAELSNFPVGIKVESSTGFLDGAASNAWERIHATVNGTECYVEVEKWDIAEEEAVLWVRVPTVSASANTSIKLEIGVNNTTTYVGETGDAAAKAVWDSDFIGVYHLNQDPTGGSGCILDSTSNERHGTPDGSHDQYDLDDGILNKAIYFDGDNSIDFSAISETPSAWTIQGVMKPSALGYYKPFFSNDLSGWNDDVMVGVDPENQFTDSRFGVTHQDSTDEIRTNAFFDTALVTNTTCFGAAVSDGDNLSAVVNDNAWATTAKNGTALDLGDNGYHIGYSVNGDRGFVGHINEVRISKVARSEAWLKADYHVLFNTLVSYSATEPASGSGLAYFSIDNTKIDAGLSNFPVGIKIESSTGFLDGLDADDWENLHATIGGTECFVEVEKWDAVNEEAILWVKVPTVSASEDTVIKLEIGADNTTGVELSAPQVLDGFEGVDGDGINSAIWTESIESGGAALSIQDNALEFSPATGTTLTRSVCTLAQVFSGDFDIQIDFDISDESFPMSGQSYLPGIDIVQSSDDEMVARLGAVARSGLPRYAFWSQGEDEASANVERTQETGGKLRITRVSGEVAVFYWAAGGSGWEWNGSSAGRVVADNNTNDIKILLSFEQENGTTCACSVDNFTINSCDSMSPGYVGETGDAAAKAVWDPDFSAVWHNATDPSGGSGCMLDSTSNEHHGTPIGSMTSEDLVAGGFGDAIDFDGVDDYIEYPSAAVDKMTVEAHFKTETDATMGICNKDRTDGPNSRCWQLSIHEEQLRGIVFTTLSTYRVEPNTNTVLDGLWHYGATKWDGSDIYCFVDENKSAGGGIVGNNVYNGTNEVWIGNGENDTQPIYTGQIGEVRVSKIARSDAWINATCAVLNGSLLTYSATDPAIGGDEPVEYSPAIVDQGLGLAEAIGRNISIAREIAASLLGLSGPGIGHNFGQVVAVLGLSEIPGRVRSVTKGLEVPIYFSNVGGAVNALIYQADCTVNLGLDETLIKDAQLSYPLSGRLRFNEECGAALADTVIPCDAAGHEIGLTEECGAFSATVYDCDCGTEGLGFSNTAARINDEFECAVEVGIGFTSEECGRGLEKYGAVVAGIGFNETAGRPDVTTNPSIGSDGLAFDNEAGAFNYTTFIRENQGRLQYKFYARLTGIADGLSDYTFPYLKSGQVRMRTGDPSLLTIVVPYTLEAMAAIAARPNGSLVLEMSASRYGEAPLREELIRADFDTVRADRGGSSQSITITAYKTHSFVGGTAVLENVVSEAMETDGTMRYRCAVPDFYLKPGHTAVYGSESFVVGTVSCVIGPDLHYMDVSE